MKNIAFLDSVFYNKARFKLAYANFVREVNHE